MEQIPLSLVLTDAMMGCPTYYRLQDNTLVSCLLYTSSIPTTIPAPNRAGMSSPPSSPPFSVKLRKKLTPIDEPTSALDPELVGEVLQALKMLAQEGWTMIIVTHEFNFAKDVADRVILMENGQVVEQNTAAEFFSHPQQDRTKQFLLQAKMPMEFKDYCI